jgi:hypothetical protein
MKASGVDSLIHQKGETHEEIKILQLITTHRDGNPALALGRSDARPDY